MHQASRAVVAAMLLRNQSTNDGWTYVLDMWMQFKISVGKIYIVLAELEREGIVESRFEAEPARKDGPRRRQYRIAPAHAIQLTAQIEQQYGSLDAAVPKRRRARR